MQNFAAEIWRGGQIDPPSKNLLSKSPVKIGLKPQDSFGEFNQFFVDLQKVQEIIRKHHQTFLQLFSMIMVM